MEQLAELGCREVCILGGEPLLMPGWFQIAKAVENLGMDLVLISNGWLINPALVKKIQRIKCLDRIGISLDGATAEVHDQTGRSPLGSIAGANQPLQVCGDLH